MAIHVTKNDKGPLTGLEFMNAVADIVGLPLHSSKIVIEAEVGKAVQVYVRQFFPRGDLPEFVRVVKELSVTDTGVVTSAPHKEADGSPHTPRQAAFRSAILASGGERTTEGLLLGGSPCAACGHPLTTSPGPHQHDGGVWAEYGGVRVHGSVCVSCRQFEAPHVVEGTS